MGAPSSDLHDVDLCDLGVALRARDISAVDARVHRIVDLKAPGSGENAKVRWENLHHLTPRDELKIVLAGRPDYEWARDLIRREALGGRVRELLLSPVHGVLDPRELVRWVLEDGLEVRVNLQLHKYIWGQEAQGV